MGSADSKQKAMKKVKSEGGILITQKSLHDMPGTPPKTVSFDEESIVKSLHELGKNVEEPQANKLQTPALDLENISGERIREIVIENLSPTSQNLRKAHYKEYEVVEVARQLIKLDLKAMGDESSNEGNGTVSDLNEIDTKEEVFPETTIVIQGNSKEGSFVIQPGNEATEVRGDEKYAPGTAE